MKTRIIALLCCFAALAPVSALADTVIFATDEWCPYSCKPDSGSPGLMIEIASMALGRRGHTVEYQLKAWDDSVALARAGKVNGVAGCSREEAEGFVFPKLPLGSAQVALFAPRNSTWRYTGPESLNGMRLGVVAGYDYGEEAAVFLSDPGKYGLTVVAATDELPLKSNFAQFAKGELDLIIGTRDVVKHVARNLGLETAIREAGVLGRPIPLFIAFSPDRPDSATLAKELDAGVTEMKESGEIAKILWKYGVLE